MKASACLIRVIIKLSARMKRCKNNTLRGNAKLVAINRDSPAIICYSR